MSLLGAVRLGSLCRAWERMVDRHSQGTRVSKHLKLFNAQTLLCMAGETKAQRLFSQSGANLTPMVGSWDIWKQGPQKSSSQILLVEGRGSTRPLAWLRNQVAGTSYRNDLSFKALPLPEASVVKRSHFQPLPLG